MLKQPFNLHCDLRRNCNHEKITNKNPKFGWSMDDDKSNSLQTKYQILVSADCENLASLIGDEWDSTPTESQNAINIAYQGNELEKNKTYFWRVRVWNNHGEVSPWAKTHSFQTGDFHKDNDNPEICLEKTINEPLFIQKNKSNNDFISFEKAAFGNLLLELTSSSDQHKIIVHIGEEKTNSNEVNKAPLGTIRYLKTELTLKKGTHQYSLSIPADKRNTGSAAILMPKEIGEVFPFQFCEIENSPHPIVKKHIKQIMVHHPFDEQASYFKCSNEILNQVWDICKYTIKATSFCGIYVDGDRERIPYEADAYINQLCHYCVDNDYLMARRSHEFLLKNPTWPTEWILHSVLMAWADYLFTGNKDSLEESYIDLKAKTLVSLKRPDGLISTTTDLVTEDVLQSIHLYDRNNPQINSKLTDIVDWPPGSFTNNGTGERDDFEMKDFNVVVNAFHYQALLLMNKIALALNRTEDASHYQSLSVTFKQSFNQAFFDETKNLYIDGIGSEHVSLHGNMFPLAFDLAPEDKIIHVLNYLKSREMACSVYGAQYFLEALYKHGGADHAFSLMTATNDRSWYNMTQHATMTMEAWDIKYKKNLDLNHAWGAAPANIIPLFLMGIKPLAPGFSKIEFQPQVSNLQFAEIKFPTIRGPIDFKINKDPAGLTTYEIQLPANTSARVKLPSTTNSSYILCNENKIDKQTKHLEIASGKTIIKEIAD